MMRQLDLTKIVRRVVRASEANDCNSCHPAPRVYKDAKNQHKYRVGPGSQFVNVFLGKVWVTVKGDGINRRVRRHGLA